MAPVADPEMLASARDDPLMKLNGLEATKIKTKTMTKKKKSTQYQQKSARHGIR